jgi:hypothetical protein
MAEQTVNPGKHVKRRRIPVALRFHRGYKVNETTECWDWIKNGGLDIDNKRYNPPRASWLIHYGAIPERKFVFRYCGNDKCVNPKHLYLGALKDNSEFVRQKKKLLEKDTLMQRFNEKWIPVPESGCWLWTGALGGDGYGAIYSDRDRKKIKAHQAAYELYKGELTPGLNIDHLCRVHCCVNPNHLEEVTHVENMRRGIVWDFNKKKTHCPKGHEYSGNNLYITTRGHRACKTCMRLKGRESYRKKLAMKNIPVWVERE